MFVLHDKQQSVVTHYKETGSVCTRCSKFKIPIESTMVVFSTYKTLRGQIQNCLEHSCIVLNLVLEK